VDLVKESYEKHAIYAKLLAMNCKLDSLQNRLVLTLAIKDSLDLDPKGLPA